MEFLGDGFFLAVLAPAVAAAGLAPRAGLSFSLSSAVPLVEPASERRARNTRLEGDSMPVRGDCKGDSKGAEAALA